MSEVILKSTYKGKNETGKIMAGSRKRKNDLKSEFRIKSKKMKGKQTRQTRGWVKNGM